MVVTYDEARDEVYLSGPHLDRAIDQDARRLADAHVAFCDEVRPLLVDLLARIDRHAADPDASTTGPTSALAWEDLRAAVAEGVPAADGEWERAREAFAEHLRAMF